MSVGRSFSVIPSPCLSVELEDEVVLGVAGAELEVHHAVRAVLRDGVEALGAQVHAQLGVELRGHVGRARGPYQILLLLVAIARHVI